MQSYRPTIENNLPPPARYRAIESQFPRDDLFREVTGADEIRHHINLPVIGLAQRLPEVGLLFPEPDMNLGKNATPPDLLGVLPGRRTRIGIERRTVSMTLEAIRKVGAGRAGWISGQPLAWRRDNAKP